MTPSITVNTPKGILSEDKSVDNKDMVPAITEKKGKYVMEIVWRNVIIFVSLHIGAVYGFYLALTSAKWMTVIFAFQDPVIHWARDHRVHHKFSETDADPHNARRGFFFSHMGWLLCKKHPEIKNTTLDLSDLESDPIVMFQQKYYMILMPLLCFVMPTVVPVYLWNETWGNAYFVSTILRYVFLLHVTWLVNSAAHMFGNKPYDKFIGATQNKAVSAFAVGEGWHNYHHVFPWDYKAAELSNYKYNLTTAFIDFFAKIGWAYDRKTASSTIVQRRVQRTGDGSHAVWGWGDKDLTQEERDHAVIWRYNNKKQ